MLKSSMVGCMEKSKGIRSLTEGSVAKALLAFTVPLVLSGLLQQLFSWVDAFIVGNVNGETALGGIGATTSIYNLFVTVITGFTAGLSVLTAQQFGRNEHKRITATLSTYTAILGVIFLLISISGIAFAHEILTIMDTPSSIFPSAEEYLSVLLAGIPFLAVYNTYSAVLRGIGNSKAPFLAIIVSSLANIALDLVFVAGLGYGPAGAAAATVIAQAAMTVFIVAYAIRRYPELRFRLCRSSFDRKAMREGAVFSLPPAIQSGASSIGSVILQQFMNGFGAQTVSAITTAYRVDTVILLPITNLGSGIATVVAQNIGAGKADRAKKAIRAGSAIMAAVSLVLTLLVFLCGEHLIAMFGLSPETTAIGRVFFHRIAVFYIVFGLSMAIRGFIEGIGDMLFSGIAGILSLVVRIVCSYALRDVFGTLVIAYAEAIAWIFMLLLYVVRYARKSREISIL